MTVAYHVTYLRPMSTFVFSHLSIYPVPVSRTRIPRRVRQSRHLHSLATISMSVHPLYPCRKKETHTRGRSTAEGTMNSLLGKLPLSRAVEGLQGTQRTVSM